MMHHTAVSAVCMCVCLLLRAGDKTLPETACEMAEGGNEEKKTGKKTDRPSLFSWVMDAAEGQQRQ